MTFNSVKAIHQQDLTKSQNSFINKWYTKIELMAKCLSTLFIVQPKKPANQNGWQAFLAVSLQPLV